jgi:hypothetical protein
VHEAHNARHVHHEPPGDVPRVQPRVRALGVGDGQRLVGGHARSHEALGVVDEENLVKELTFRSVGAVGDKVWVEGHRRFSPRKVPEPAASAPPPVDAKGADTAASPARRCDCAEPW